MLPLRLVEEPRSPLCLLRHYLYLGGRVTNLRWSQSPARLDLFPRGGPGEGGSQGTLNLSSISFGKMYVSPPLWWAWFLSRISDTNCHLQSCRRGLCKVGCQVEEVGAYFAWVSRSGLLHVLMWDLHSCTCRTGSRILCHSTVPAWISWPFPHPPSPASRSGPSVVQWIPPVLTAVHIPSLRLLDLYFHLLVSEMCVLGWQEWFLAQKLQKPRLKLRF